MVEYALIALSAFLAAGLTLFSGFGLATILMPVMVLFVPVDIAIALTAVVHFFNNLLKLGMFARLASLNVVLRFGLTAIPSAMLGASALLWLSDLQPLFSYTLFGNLYSPTPLGMIVAGLMVLFAIIELSPRFDTFSFGKQFVPVGGALSGFMGGLSGHQGALRSLFLLRCGLTKEGFIATGVVIASIVDVSRLLVYSGDLLEATSGGILLLFTASVAALLGTAVARRFVDVIPFKAVRTTVAVMLIMLAVGLGTGML